MTFGFLIASSTRKNRSAPPDPLLAQGLRPIQIWVPDVLAANFQEQAHRQSQAVVASAHTDTDQRFIDAISALDFGD